MSKKKNQNLKLQITKSLYKGFDNVLTEFENDQKYRNLKIYQYANDVPETYKRSLNTKSKVISGILTEEKGYKNMSQLTVYRLIRLKDEAGPNCNGGVDYYNKVIEGELSIKAAYELAFSKKENDGVKIQPECKQEPSLQNVIPLTALREEEPNFPEILNTITKVLPEWMSDTTKKINEYKYKSLSAENGVTSKEIKMIIDSLFKLQKDEISALKKAIIEFGANIDDDI